ncbi:hypothetical protein [Litchfieldia alkalitelluris]|uniref:hypothetical protein n=1 Tax=Litchfieldia alkalitelluris TaxID=304268 RepID=UPI001475C69D|nr:hypothetical protein [Litchfieldia alkalitelluris]
MIYKILLNMTIVIFILDLYIFPRFTDIETDNSGLFTGLMMLCVIIGHILNREKPKSE